VWRCLFSGVAGHDSLAGLLPARHAEMSRRRQPVRQDGEGFPARPANPAPHPDALVSVVVGLAEPPTVASDRVVLADRAQPRQEMQRHYPGVNVVFVVRQCDKKNHGWREGPPLTVACEVSICWPGLHPPGKVSIQTKKEYCFPLPAASSPLRTLAGYKRQSP
jgi:hypothetical protein